ncbi:MAG: S8 family serine peptidase, partial [Anaerolineales bacterium]|nr:S8 family serine peptidase [Anaerolineales bacterium]
NFTYQHAFNGLSVNITPLEAAKIAKMDGVSMVTRSETRELLTDVGPEWIGAPGIWDGSGVSSGLNTYGEGVVVAILDTGINSAHPSFAAVGQDGYVHTNPITYYLGVCNPDDPDYQPSFVCNDKLIGVHDFIDGDGNDPDSPEDGDGHGSHTASTVAGNFVTATLFAPTAAITDTISGVAPHANIIAYDVCRNGPVAAGGGCPNDATLAAVNQVVADSAILPNGIAAINYSISGGTSPYNDPVELAFLAATDAGIFVSASAGNSGPDAGTVAHVSPWVSTVAASTHNRSLVNNVIDLTSDGDSLTDIDGIGFTAGYGPAPILYAGDFGDALCLNPFAGGTFNGEIVICDRGTNDRVDKGANVLAGGAGGMILADNGAGQVSDAHFLPATHINQADGAALKAWVAGNTNPVGTISGTSVDLSPSNGDIMAGFSSRGPVGAFGVLKPDVTAPGVSIWAAVQSDGDATPDYGFLSGTSMSSPHNAGAAALMAALYPTWTPHQIKSAMMLTADNVDNFKEDGTTPTDPFDLGAGRIQVAVAANAGFVLNETTENFENADPALNNNSEAALQALNIASLANANCVGGCSWERTIASTLAVDADYTVTVTAPAGITITVTPETFTLPAGGTQLIEVTADVSGASVGDW